jgi:hypothetical protein
MLGILLLRANARKHAACITVFDIVLPVITTTVNSVSDKNLLLLPSAPVHLEGWNGTNVLKLTVPHSQE